MVQQGRAGNHKNPKGPVGKACQFDVKINPTKTRLWIAKAALRRVKAV
jgi:hypothetical protein